MNDICSLVLGNRDIQGRSILHDDDEHDIERMPENIITRVLYRPTARDCSNHDVSYSKVIALLPEVPALFSVHGGSWRDVKDSHYHFVIDNNLLFQRFKNKTITDHVTMGIAKVMLTKVGGVGVEEVQLL